MVQSHLLPYSTLHSYAELFKAVKGPESTKIRVQLGRFGHVPCFGEMDLDLCLRPEIHYGDCKPMGSWAQIDFIGITFLEISCWHVRIKSYPYYKFISVILTLPFLKAKMTYGSAIEKPPERLIESTNGFGNKPNPQKGFDQIHRWMQPLGHPHHEDKRLFIFNHLFLHQGSSPL